jgi:hypothetical protein
MPELKPIPPISLETPQRTQLPVSGGNHARIENGRLHIRVGADGLSWDEAQRLYGWLKAALGEEPDGLEPEFT